MHRSPAVPLTRTDFAIYLRTAARLGVSIETYMMECFSSDNRDADLMLILIEWRNVRSKPDAWDRALQYALTGQLR
jgi:hypothetical protein